MSDDTPNPPPPPGPPPGYWEQHAAEQAHQAAGGVQFNPQSAYPTGPAPGRPNLPKANTALILGLVGTIGGLFCLLPILVSPLAWVLGHQARKEIRASGGQYGGDGNATAGMVLGIIGTVMLILGLIVLTLVVIVVLVGHHPVTTVGPGTKV